MKIAVWLNNDMVPQEGGAYTYIHSLVKLLDEAKFEGTEIVFLTYGKSQHLSMGLKKEIIYLNEHFKFGTYVYKLLRKIFNRSRFLNIRIQTQTYTLIKNKDVDVIYYLNQAQREVEGFPFIATNWDIAHLSLSKFPEFNGNGQLQKRQNWYSSVLKEATLVAAESEAGKTELIKYINLDPDKIVVVPFFIEKNHTAENSEQGLRILDRFNLQVEKYFYYPAQYWKHKNHATLVNAFKRFNEVCGEGTKLVFSGSDKGELTEIKHLINNLQLTDQVFCFNFVTAAEKEALLENALSLVMPTFLGPTNLPPLEAMAYDVPCICSNLEGHKEMLGDSAIYFNPSSVLELSDALLLVNHPNERARLKLAIKTKKQNTIFNSEGAKNGLNNLFLELKTKMLKT